MLDGRRWRANLVSPRMAHPKEEWRNVSPLELDAFVRDYVGTLEARPPVARGRVNFREWMDPALGAWPHNVVAKAWRRGRCTGNQVRVA